MAYNRIQLKKILNKTHLFYTMSFGELHVVSLDDGVIHFKDASGRARLTCNYNDIFPVDTDEYGNEYFTFITMIDASHKLYPIKREYLKLLED